MAGALRTLDGLDYADRTVLLRSDFNVPLNRDGDRVTVADDQRIRAALPTISRLREKGARVVILAHLGRPKGQPSDELSLRPVAGRLSELIEAPMLMAPAVSGPAAQAVVAQLGPGDVALLENVRFDPRETSKDPVERQSLAREWAELGDVYVGDGFGVVHRAQASVTELATDLPSAAGLLVEREVAVFDKILSNPLRPFTVVLGGAKVADKLPVVANLLPKVDRIVIGGGMCFTFLAAQGHAVGSSLVESEQVDAVRSAMAQAEEQGVELLLPTDVVIAQKISAEAPTEVVAVADGIPDGWMGLDIGPATSAAFAKAVEESATVAWNGPMGVFELTPFAAGTRTVAEALTRVEGTSVVGGGDSAAAIHKLGIDASKITHISTGGGASLELLEGKHLPGLAVLEGPQS
ncbi:MAG: phosphoglycerate kinase [Candidatus Nanopelagicales bacterium]|nr:phosphoglycerate kinase [Candidatus Nanopelagicales bacterium]